MNVPYNGRTIPAAAMGTAFFFFFFLPRGPAETGASFWPARVLIDKGPTGLKKVCRSKQALGRKLQTTELRNYEGQSDRRSTKRKELFLFGKKSNRHEG